MAEVLQSLERSRKQQKIPAPNFIEFYNGSTAIADCTELRLSSAFEHLSGEPKLELIVTVLNVNEGHNAELMQHCNTLNEYAQYVARVRHYASDMPLNQAVKRAVDECIREGILAEFLARMLKTNNFSLEEIAAFSGVSLDDVKILKANQ
jgi:hypothetical protein